jgi:hypothetical protein
MKPMTAGASGICWRRIAYPNNPCTYIEPTSKSAPLTAYAPRLAMMVHTSRPRSANSSGPGGLQHRSADEQGQDPQRHHVIGR